MKQDLLKYLYSLSNYQKGSIKLENIKLIHEKMGLCDRNYQTIHVAGTNGKGSVCKKIQQALMLSGYKVGLYTSPHIATFRERIQINDEIIKEDEAFTEIKKILSLYEQEGIKETFFEVMTLLAFSYFAQQKVDYAVFETGLGGRLDATNLLSPILTVITSISHDHTNIFGDDLEAIAYEKGGIIKPFIPVVLGPTAIKETITQIAQEKQAPMILCQSIHPVYDEENQEIAKKALIELQKTILIPTAAIEEGILKRPTCRFEKVKENVILDVAHNPAGFEKLHQALLANHPDKKFYFVIGISKDKDVAKCLQILTTFASHIFLLPSLEERLLSHEGFIKYFDALLFPYFTQGKDVDDSMSKAIALATENNGMVVCCGSFFIMKHIKEFLRINQETDPLMLNEKVL